MANIRVGALAESIIVQLRPLQVEFNLSDPDPYTSGTTNAFQPTGALLASSPDLSYLCDETRATTPLQKFHQMFRKFTVSHLMVIV